MTRAAWLPIPGACSASRRAPGAQLALCRTTARRQAGCSSPTARRWALPARAAAVRLACRRSDSGDLLLRLLPTSQHFVVFWSAHCAIQQQQASGANRSAQLLPVPTAASTSAPQAAPAAESGTSGKGTGHCHDCAGDVVIVGAVRTANCRWV